MRAHKNFRAVLGTIPTRIKRSHEYFVRGFLYSKKHELEKEVIFMMSFGYNVTQKVLKIKFIVQKTTGQIYTLTIKSIAFLCFRTLGEYV